MRGQLKQPCCCQIPKPFRLAAQMRSAFPLTAVLLISVALARAAAASCPDVLPFRSSHVQTAFNESKMTGTWCSHVSSRLPLPLIPHPPPLRYEHAFIDVAQVGSRCQRLAASLSAAARLQVAALDALTTASARTMTLFFRLRLKCFMATSRSPSSRITPPTPTSRCWARTTKRWRSRLASC